MGGFVIRTIGVDFDGVIHRYSRGWHDGTIYDPPVPGALDGLRTLMQHGPVFIHTARSPRQVAAWLANHGFDTCVEAQVAPITVWAEHGRLLVTRRKLPASAYLDDRAVAFTSWPAALAELLPAEAAPTAPRSGDDAVVQVPVKDLRLLVEFAACHLDSPCGPADEHVAVIERVLAEITSSGERRVFEG